MEEEGQEREQLLASWQTSVRRGTDFDLWGQPVEAIDCYNRLAAHLRIEGGTGSTLFTDGQKKILNKISVCLEIRSRSLQSPGKIEGVTLEDLRKIDNCLTNIQALSIKEFPVDISKAHVLSSLKTPDPVSPASIKATDHGEDGEDIVEARLSGNLRPPPVPVPRETSLTVRIEKIGIKDASQYIDSFITISVKDTHGFDLTSPQDTPVATLKEDTYVFFGVDVHIQKTMESLPAGFAIFFEFKHYKPKKRVLSTRCWSFMEKDEIKEGPGAVELYQKPTDSKRKKIKLLTVKPLYLHIKVFMN